MKTLVVTFKVPLPPGFVSTADGYPSSEGDASKATAAAKGNPVMSNSACALALILAASLTAGAAAAREPTSSRVFYGDLNLASPQGARTMLRRIRGQAEKVCQPSHSPGTAPEQPWTATERCRQAAIPSAVLRLHAPLVAAEFDRSLGRTRMLTAAR